MMLQNIHSSVNDYNLKENESTTLSNTMPNYGLDNYNNNRHPTLPFKIMFCTNMNVLHFLIQMVIMICIKMEGIALTTIIYNESL
jgi:hypothetical protein